MTNSASNAGYHFFGDFRKCQKYWEWKYVHKLLPLTDAAALSNGKAFHDSMEIYYTNLKEGTPSPSALLIALNKLHEFPLLEDDMRKLDDALRMYSMHYANDNFKILAIEQDFEQLFTIKVRRAKYTKNVRVYLTGRIDLIVEINGKVYIIDHKTTKWIIGKVAEANELSDQATGYIALWNAAHPENPAHAAMYNIVKLEARMSGGDPTKDLMRPVVYRSQADIDGFLLDIAETSREIQQKLTKPNCRFVKDRNACFLYNSKCAYADLCAGADPQKLIGISYKINEDVAEQQKEELL
jgi:hypothetical protein